MIPWAVRYALAAYDAGKPLPPWLLMSVQILRNGGGCAACRSARPVLAEQGGAR